MYTSLATATTVASTGSSAAGVVCADGDCTNVADTAIKCVENFQTIHANMNAIGEVGGQGQHLHHIIPQGAQRAQEARDIFTTFFDINSSTNGLYLDATQHMGLHTNAYYDFVNATMRANSGSGQAVVEGIKIIIEFIKNGG